MSYKISIKLPYERLVFDSDVALKIIDLLANAEKVTNEYTDNKKIEPLKIEELDISLLSTTGYNKLKVVQFLKGDS